MVSIRQSPEDSSPKWLRHCSRHRKSEWPRAGELATSGYCTRQVEPFTSESIARPCHGGMAQKCHSLGNRVRWTSQAANTDMSERYPEVVARNWRSIPRTRLQFAGLETLLMQFIPINFL